MDSCILGFVVGWLVGRLVDAVSCLLLVRIPDDGDEGRKWVRRRRLLSRKPPGSVLIRCSVSHAQTAAVPGTMYKAGACV